jgi:hypothetical protein
MYAYKLTFTENTKYNPVTRTVTIKTPGNEYTARELLLQQYGRTKITITEVKEIKDSKEEN